MFRDRDGCKRLRKGGCTEEREDAGASGASPAPVAGSTGDWQYRISYILFPRARKGLRLCVDYVDSSFALLYLLTQTTFALSARKRICKFLLDLLVYRRRGPLASLDSSLSLEVSSSHVSPKFRQLLNPFCLDPLSCY